MQIIRSKRKTLALVVGPDGSVSVRAPLRLPQSVIDAFVRDKSAWIQQKQAEARQRSERCGRPQGFPHRFEPGEAFLYLGKLYPLELVARQERALVFDGTFRLKKESQPHAAKLFEAWYKIQARDLFSHRLADLSKQTGLRFTSLRLSSARTRWGSCSSRGTISLNWKLIMAPPEVIDYVIIHELAHVQEKNHSKHYWALVERILPGYRPLRGWLKTNGMCLSWP
jgi:predicted metal-dependent hydrolase